MADLLIRGLSERAVERLDEEASNLGLSRNELLKRRLEQEVSQQSRAVITAEDWRRSAEAFVDLDDPSVMDGAWR